MGREGGRGERGRGREEGGRKEGERRGEEEGREGGGRRKRWEIGIDKADVEKGITMAGKKGNAKVNGRVLALEVVGPLLI